MCHTTYQSTVLQKIPDALENNRLCRPSAAWQRHVMDAILLRACAKHPVGSGHSKDVWRDEELWCCCIKPCTVCPGPVHCMKLRKQLAVALQNVYTGLVGNPTFLRDCSLHQVHTVLHKQPVVFIFRNLYVPLAVQGSGAKERFRWLIKSKCLVISCNR